MNKLENFTNMVWVTKNSLTKVRNMDTVHIRNTIKTIKSGKGGCYCGHSSQDWIIAFKLELERRDELGDKILSLFPNLQREFNRICNPTQQQTFKRFFTTKGIKELNYARTIS